MREVIEQFMWGYQQQFRNSLRYEIDQSLRLIGLDADPTVLLIGLADPGHSGHPVCIEPETGTLVRADLAGLDALAQELYERDSESEVWNTDPGTHERHQSGVKARATGAAIARLIQESGRFAGREVVVGSPGRQGAYVVYPVALLEAATFGELAALEDDVVDRMYVGRSLQHEVVAECLNRAAVAVERLDAGRGLRILGDSRDDLVRVAGRTLLDGLTIRAVHMPNELFERLSRIVELPYERTGASGRLIIAEPASIELDLSLRNPVSLAKPRAARKILETCRSGLDVVCDGRTLIGLRSPSAGSSGPVLEIEVLGTAEWSVSYDGTQFMQVSFGRPRLPVTPISFEGFSDTLRRQLGDCDVEAIWALVQNAQHLGHGTTIVVLAKAASESERLGGQGQPLEPLALSQSQLESLAAVDGALIVDPQGVCHAFGIILDGVSDGEGDPARGSRYNSAVRYCRSLSSPSIAVIVSDDGFVDLVPTLRRRIERTVLDELLASFEDTLENDHLNGEPYARARDRIDQHAFYFDQAQCDRINGIEEAIWARRVEGGGPRLIREPLGPSPEMNDTYFLD